MRGCCQSTWQILYTRSNRCNIDITVQKIGTLGSNPLGWRGRPVTTRIDCHVPAKWMHRILLFLLVFVWDMFQNLGYLMPCSLGWGGVDPQFFNLTVVRYVAKFSTSTYNCWNVRVRRCEKFCGARGTTTLQFGWAPDPQNASTGPYMLCEI